MRCGEIPIRLHRKMAVTALAVTILASALIVSAVPDRVADGAALSAALCPIVYPVDQTAPGRGNRYFFFGNAFFINEKGYLITAAHVVSSFRDGGKPHILIGAPGEPRRLLEATLVGVDWIHDVAVLRATPNPFDGEHKPAFLPLSTEIPSPGKPVLAVAQHPATPQGGYTVDEPSEERLSGEVLDLHFTGAETGVGDSELLLLSQEVEPGYSGSPVVSADSQNVVGIVVGKWTRPGVIPFGNTAAPVPAAPGAALRIHYAIALLRSLGIPWHMASGATEPKQDSTEPAKGFSAPVPLSIVATPYPPQALFGGEVALDALIDASGKLTDLRVVRGDPPFLDTVLGAVRTWSFLPAHLDGRAVDARIGIVFQFPQSFLPPLTARERKYEEPLADSAERGALPVVTVEPQYPPNTVIEGSVALYGLIDQNGQITSTQVLRDVEPLTDTTIAALHDWRFVPGKQGQADTESAVVVVVTFRRPAVVRR